MNAWFSPQECDEATPVASAQFQFRRPRSRIVEPRCTKPFARTLVRNGVHPLGCIWVPGVVSDRPDIGDLFGPDDTWTAARPLLRSVEGDGTVDRGEGRREAFPSYDHL